MTDKYALKFTFDTAQTDDLIEGILQLLKNGTVINEYRATCSTAGRQADGSWKQRGGLIPPSSDLPTKEYLVDTKPIYMPEVKGVNGNFYCITPYSVPTKGATRGDFGIHFDANVPGSLGCIVLRTARGWEAIQRDIANIFAVGLKQVSLVVEYI
jgi:hypothetical protein